MVSNMVASSPSAVNVSWQHSNISRMTCKPSKLGQTDLVFGLLKLKTNLYSAIKSEDSEALDGGTSQPTARGSMVK